MQVKQNSSSFVVPLLVVALLLPLSLSAQPQRRAVRSSSAAQRSHDRSLRRSAQPERGAASTAPLPNAPQPAASPAPRATASSQPLAQPAPQPPLGAAAAEQIKTAGGGASRPAGNAIAPVKQHQYRSLVIKLGAAAAAGIAVGTVYGLSHATSSTPPHATSCGRKVMCHVLTSRISASRSWSVFLGWTAPAKRLRSTRCAKPSRSSECAARSSPSGTTSWLPPLPRGFCA